MPTKEEMIKKIYEKIAEKSIKKGDDTTIASMYDVRRDNECWVCGEYGTTGHQCERIDIMPVMIGDVLDWYNKNEKVVNEIGEYSTKTVCSEGCFMFASEIFLDKLLNCREEKRKPIEDNPEAIEFIYSLVTKGH